VRAATKRPTERTFGINQANNNNTMQSSKVSQLQVMFPDMDAGTISSVLGAKNDNVDQAIEALLALNVTTLSEEDKKRAKDSNFNEVLQKVTANLFPLFVWS